MDRDTRLKRLRFRAWHRGTREADLLIGGFFDAHGAAWSKAEMVWFEALLEEQDVDIMAWAIGAQPCPPAWEGEMMQAMRGLGYVPLQSEVPLPPGERDRLALASQGEGKRD